MRLFIMSESENPEPARFVPDEETLADAKSLDYKQITMIDPAHGLQTKAGGLAGAVAGAAIGTNVAGPVGTLIGAAVGALAGMAGGKIAGEMFDPSAESEYWMAHHGLQPFAPPGAEYADYEMAYRTGYNNYAPGETFEQAEDDLKRYYEDHGGHFEWEKARPAARAAWDRMSYIFPLEKMNRV